MVRCGLDKSVATIRGPCRRGAAARGLTGALVIAAMVGGGAGCVTSPVVSPAPKSVEKSEEPLKVHLVDGRLAVLDTWRADEKGIHGEGRAYDVERLPLPKGYFHIPHDQIALVETSRTLPSPAVIPMVVGTIALTVTTVICLANPKACFGSCPTFYVPGPDGQPKLQAEGFSTSIARLLEADDVDDLPDARPDGGKVRVLMRNEALETHAVRSVSLLALKGPPGATVVRGETGVYLALTPPVAAASVDGAPDAGEALSARDGKELFSEADAADLATREEVTLHFAAPRGPGAEGGPGGAAIVLAVRNSLLTTFLYYHLLALFGTRAGEFMARVERGELEALRGLAGWGQHLGGIDVAVRQGNAPFRFAGTIEYVGPIALETRSVQFEVADLRAPVDVRLSFARGNVRIDQAALGAVVATGLVPVEIAPSVTAAGRHPPDGAEASLRGQGSHLVTYPGDDVTMEFAVPESLAGASFFVKSRGYYYEWVRSEWLAEENVAEALEHLRDPRAALRALAPLYKRHEPTMEEVFRASRFVRQR